MTSSPLKTVSEANKKVAKKSKQKKKSEKKKKKKDSSDESTSDFEAVSPGSKSDDSELKDNSNFTGSQFQKILIALFH